MQKIYKSAVTIFMATAFCCVLPSCKGNNSGEGDTTVVEENVVNETIENVTVNNQVLITDTLAQRYNKAFFDNNAKKSENPSDSTWVKTGSGLKYVVVKEGTGAQPTREDNVTVHYTGRLTDGTVFDSSVQRGEPTSFPLSQVIPGWTEGLQYMKEGGVTTFYIPADIAYGSQGNAVIPANSDLIFDVQLISVNQ